MQQKYFTRRIIVLSVILFLLGACRSSQKISLPPGIKILTRSEWGAAAPVLPMKTQQLDRITIHHTAVKQNPSRSLADKLQGLQKFSQQRSPLSDGRIKEPWADIPYHFYIAADGSVGEGRELKYVGDSNTPYDPTGHALIVLEGNFNIEPVTTPQFASLRKLVINLSSQYGIDSSKISGHKDHAQTGCPGDQLYALIPGLKRDATLASKAH